LHTGNETSITFCPAPENYGYKFIRTDLPEHVEIEAIVDNVVDLSRGTTLGIGDVKVHTVEHVLAALVGLKIDNCRIELSGNEPPVGMAVHAFCRALLKPVLKSKQLKEFIFILMKQLDILMKQKVLILLLFQQMTQVTVMVDYHNPALGSQHTGMFNMEKEFITDFAPARTFCFLTEVELLRDQGLIKGGSIDTLWLL